MSRILNQAFRIDQFAVPTSSAPLPQETKGEPLSAFLPDRDKYLTLSPARYTSPEFADREWERLWTKTWLCAGRLSDLPRVGAWFRFDIGRESFIIVRSAEEEISAVYNVCQHRANRLIDDDFGSASAFVCPYHSWKFDRRGKCVHVTDRELFKDEALAGSLDLPAIRCETFGGFVFVSMNPEAPPLSEFLGGIDRVMSSYPLESYKVRSDLKVEMACNWKILLDAFSEHYHVHMTHPGAMPFTEDKFTQTDFYPNGHIRRIVPSGNPSARRPAGEYLHPVQRKLLEAAGQDPAEFETRPTEVRQALQRVKRARGGAFAEATKNLSDNQLTDSWAVNIFPNMEMTLRAEGALMMRFMPHPTDQNRCTLHILVLQPPDVDFDWFIPPTEVVEHLGRPARLYLKHDDPDLQSYIGQILYEDMRNTRESQLGLYSKGFRQVRLSEQEQALIYAHAEIDRYLSIDPGTHV